MNKLHEMTEKRIKYQALDDLINYEDMPDFVEDETVFYHLSRRRALCRGCHRVQTATSFYYQRDDNRILYTKIERHIKMRKCSRCLYERTLGGYIHYLTSRKEQGLVKIYIEDCDIPIKIRLP